MCVARHFGMRTHSSGKEGQEGELIEAATEVYRLIVSLYKRKEDKHTLVCIIGTRGEAC
jgi:hypothetical protein